MKPRVEVWHGDRRTFAQDYRSGAAARRDLASRIEDCLTLGLKVCVTKQEGWWVFTCEREGVAYSIRMNEAGV